MNDNNMTAKKIADVLAIGIIVAILFAVFGMTGIFSELGARLEGKEEKTTVSTYSTSEITELDIEVATASITILTGDTLSIENDRFGFKLNEKKGKINLEERGGIYALDRNRRVIITVPADFTFEKVEIETGASDIAGDGIKAQQLDFDIGAGSISLGNLEVTGKADVDCGAGEFIVSNGRINNLKFSLGVGTAKISSALTSDCDFECGVGELELNLPDDKNNYTFDFDTGLGPVKLDSQRVKSGDTVGEGANRVHIEGGVGSVDITFNK